MVPPFHDGKRDVAGSHGANYDDGGVIGVDDSAGQGHVQRHCTLLLKQHSAAKRGTCFLPVNAHCFSDDRGLRK